MKILDIKVDKLPKNCGECSLRNDNYCMIKYSANDRKSAWVEKFAEDRDVECPLRENDTWIGFCKNCGDEIEQSNPAPSYYCNVCLGEMQGECEDEKL